MTDIKKEVNSDNYLKIFFWIALSLVIISIAFPFIINYIFTDWSVSGTFGDTFGALNALFSGLALTGVIVTILIQRSELKNQRIELQLQRSEMQETRKEFLLNRTTNLVYKQLERFEKSLTDFKITIVGTKYFGNDAISKLEEKYDELYQALDKPNEEVDNEMKEAIIKLLKVYVPNKIEIEKFAQNAYNSVEVLKRLVYKSQLDLENINELKNIFFVNIGFSNMETIRQISEIGQRDFELLEPQDYVNANLDVGRLVRANIFLKPILKFYELRLTDENFEENKVEWIKSRGNEG
ncbi:hypothetical protein [uncultured Christiangramia sp.]|uniref:hypothetical protein n=1 Tax=uncultured Christiangramia sp. TaxID=503836 RepID=UPI0026171169|nr:hypothetical protein [uncultured Christiangramia sp.]